MDSYPEQLRSACSSRLISIVSPVYNEEENLLRFYEQVRSVMEALGQNFELIIVDDGSVDRSLEILKALHLKDDRVNYLSLSRNFGHQAALIAGLEHSRGDAVISLDADLQHPPELISEMLKLWDEGYEVVYTTKREEDRTLSFFQRLLNRRFYAVMSRISGLELSSGQADFRLMERRAVDALCRIPERNKFLRGLVSWIGFRQIGIAYDVPPRLTGKSKFRFAHRFKFALDGIFSFSIIPLRMFTLFGALVSLLAFLYGLAIVGIGAYAFMTGYHWRIAPGWTTIVAGVFFFSGVQLIGIGLLGEYLGRVYDETKERPVYLVREHSLPGFCGSYASKRAPDTNAGEGC